jgi:hypothetical protein
MTGEVTYHELAVTEFLNEASRQAINDVLENMTADAAMAAPVLNPAITRLPGEKWSLPGNLKRSVHSRVDEDINGRPYGLLMASSVANFMAKRAHAIRNFIRQALERQAGRSV